LGQLGQAYLALLYFLDRHPKYPVLLVDYDKFELVNRSSQILLDHTRVWEGKYKATFLEAKLSGLGWNVKAEIVKLAWGWPRPTYHPGLALLGLDNFDARRLVASLGYEWIFEAGVGTSFIHPKVTWHSFPARGNFPHIFPSDEGKVLGEEPATPFERDLNENTPEGCGWVIFNRISASAPSMGLVASAYTWIEVLNYLSGERIPINGLAHLWTPLLPYTRSEMISNSQ
jgi:hypothetical protein